MWLSFLFLVHLTCFIEFVVAAGVNDILILLFSFSVRFGDNLQHHLRLAGRGVIGTSQDKCWSQLFFVQQGTCYQQYRACHTRFWMLTCWMPSPSCTGSIWSRSHLYIMLLSELKTHRRWQYKPNNDILSGYNSLYARSGEFVVHSSLHLMTATLRQSHLCMQRTSNVVSLATVGFRSSLLSKQGHFYSIYIADR